MRGIVIKERFCECIHGFEFDLHRLLSKGAIYVRSAEATVRKTIIERNDSVFGGIGTRGTITAFDSDVRLEDSLMHGDVGPGHALGLWDSAGFVVRSTVADTSPSLAVFGMNGTAALVLFDSIVHEAEGADILNEVGGSPQATTKCVLRHDDALTALGPNTDTEVGEPRFADRENELFYLSPDSPAINYCGDAPPAPAVDLEWNPRGICHSVNLPLCLIDQISDLGAYELPLGLFRDRFESPFL